MPSTLRAMLAEASGEVLRRIAAVLVLYIAAAICAVAALGYGVAAAYYAMEPHLGPVAAALVVGGILLVVALAAVLAAQGLQRQAAREARRRTAELKADLAVAAPMVAMPLALRATRRAPALVALAALGVGFLLMRRRGPRP